MSSLVSEDREWNRGTFVGTQEAIACVGARAGKKTYTFLMGKPNPAKLANFPEVDVFVLIADPEGLILDSREYYAPLITAYEAHLAFSPDAQWAGTYCLDFDCLLVRFHLSSSCEPCESLS